MLARRQARNAPGQIEIGAPPASPLERNPQSPKGWKKREADGVGLGIVAALQKPPPKLVVAASAPITISLRPAGAAGAAGAEFPAADFLSCCFLCRKRLQGKDIYMYKGEKAFCSMECRYQQIVSDECVEKCGSTEVLRPPVISSSPCSGGRSRLFFTGIVAA